MIGQTEKAEVAGKAVRVGDVVEFRLNLDGEEENMDTVGVVTAISPRGISVLVWDDEENKPHTHVLPFNVIEDALKEGASFKVIDGEMPVINKRNQQSIEITAPDTGTKKMMVIETWADGISVHVDGDHLLSFGFEDKHGDNLCVFLYPEDFDGIMEVID